MWIFLLDRGGLVHDLISIRSNDNLYKFHKFEDNVDFFWLVSTRPNSLPNFSQWLLFH
jgi:hypothetical protein